MNDVYRGGRISQDVPALAFADCGVQVISNERCLVLMALLWPEVFECTSWADLCTEACIGANNVLTIRTGGCTSWEISEYRDHWY